jgi:glycosyltransferase involved in cell wall biosynthesis
VTDINGLNRVMVILYGSLEFDGRVRRMIEILTELASVMLVDIATDNPTAPASPISDRFERHSIALANVRSPARRHLALWKGALRAAASFNPDLVVAEDYFAAFPAWLVARRGAGRRLVYDAHELIIPGDGLQWSRREAFWYRLESWVVRRSDLVVAANQQRARLMQEHYRLRTTPTFLRNIPALRVSDTVSEDWRLVHPALERSSDVDRILIYQGDVRLARGLGRFIDALHHLPSNYRLVIAGDGPDAAAIASSRQSLIESRRLSMLGRVPNESLRMVTALADLGIVSYPFEGLNNIYCAPNKLFEYAQAGLPVVSTDQPPLADAVNRYGIGGLVSRDDDSRTIASVIESVLEARELHRAGLARFLSENRWEDEAARIVGRIERLYRRQSN